VQVVHDFEHRGVNNDFLVRSGDGLALLYNDRSPHENHHLAASWGLMIEHNLLRGLNHKQKVCRGYLKAEHRLPCGCHANNLSHLVSRSALVMLHFAGPVCYQHRCCRLLLQELLRRLMIELVLATDMKQHFAIHGLFQAKLHSQQQHTAQRHQRGPPSSSSSHKWQQQQPAAPADATCHQPFPQHYL